MPTGQYTRTENHKAIAREWIAKNRPKGKKGELNPSWKGGVSKDRKSYMKDYMKSHKQDQKSYHARKVESIATHPRTENCEICDIPEKDLKKSLCYDHNHETNVFRGWLCGRCNLLLGQIEKNSSLIDKMKQYLKNNK